MKHKVVQIIEDEPARDIILNAFKHQSAVTSEAFSVLSTLNKPPSGFRKLQFYQWSKLDTEVSPTVIDQFMEHCRHLQSLSINGYYLNQYEADRLNMCDLVSKIIDVQAEDKLDSLTIMHLACAYK